ncbi:MAG: hypothetical protein ACRD11_15735 [Terriglobia bacterium]
MNQKTLVTMIAGLVLLAPIGLWAQTSPAAGARRLVTAKSIYVKPMPDNLDQWIIQDLRAWGKYQVSANSEGVDLVLSARTPEDNGLSTPRGVGPRIRRPRKPPSIFSLAIVNWVTGARLWQVDILNKGPKKGQPPPPPGPRTQVDARHMKPDELAERCTDLLRRYVEALEQAPAAKP